MNWISNKEKLPSDKETVLILFSNGCFGFAYRLETESSVFWVCEEEIIPDDEIIYWISLFDIPKPNQPERSKREDFVKAKRCGACNCVTFACDAQDGCPTKMRCSEHNG
jgi:hypothetical protein